MIIRKLLLVVTVLSALSIPVIAEAEGFSVGDEREVGEKLQSIIRQDFRLIDYPDVAQYINNLGNQVLLAAGAQYFNYQFFVINNKEFNAFAAPSGLIFIHSGLIASMDSEDELVGVIAHEIAHVSKRHLAERIEKASKINMGTIAMVLAGIAIGSSGEGELSEAVITGSMAAGASLNLKFSRENEEEADRIAFSWMNKIGRDPKSLLSMLSKMRRISILKIGNVPPYLLTHPDPAQRMDYINDLLNTYPGGPSPKKLSDFAFQRIRFRILADSRDSRDFIPRLQQTIANTSGTDYTAKLGLAMFYLHDGDFIKARKYLEELIVKFPEQHILKTDLGITFLKEEKATEAKKLLKEALQADPDCAFTVFNLARVLEQENKWDQAIELYGKLLTSTPTFSRSHYYLAQALTKTGRPELGHFHTGQYNLLEGNITIAKYHFGKALEILPADSPYRIVCKDMLDKITRLEKL